MQPQTDASFVPVEIVHLAVEPAAAKDWPQRHELVCPDDRACVDCWRSRPVVADKAVQCHACWTPTQPAWNYYRQDLPALWPCDHITSSRISQGHSLYQVWTLWDHSFLSYAADRQTDRCTQDAGERFTPATIVSNYNVISHDDVMTIVSIFLVAELVADSTPDESTAM